MIRALSICLLASVALPVAAQDGASVPEGGDPIVVTGLRIETTERNLADCLARECPPDEDIDASLAHAENLFVAGRYRDAQGITLRALERNRRHAEQYPVDVSDLNRVHSRIAVHMGEKETYRKATVAIRSSLLEGLSENDPQVTAATLEMAKMYFQMGWLDVSEANYRDARKMAEKINRPDYAAYARLGMAQIEFARGGKERGRRVLREVAQDGRPEMWNPRLRALVMLVQLEEDEDRPAVQRQLSTVLSNLGVSKPTLIYAPPFDLKNSPSFAEGTSVSTTDLLSTKNFNGSWADIGFWVNSKGEVEDPDLLRSSGDAKWLSPLMESIRARRYTPTEVGGYRVERYTYTSFWRNETGSRIRTRSADARIEYLDLTDTPDAAPPENDEQTVNS